MPTGKMKKLLEDKLKLQPELDETLEQPEMEEIDLEEDLPEEEPLEEEKETPFSELSRDEKLAKLYDDYTSGQEDYKKKLGEARESDRKSQMWQGILKNLGTVLSAQTGGAKTGYTAPDPIKGMQIIDPKTRKDVEADRKSDLNELMQQYKLLKPKTGSSSFQPVYTKEGIKLLDRSTGEISDTGFAREYAPKTVKDSLTGETYMVDSDGGVIKTYGSPTKPKEGKKVTKYSQLNSEQRKQIKDQKDSFEKETKDMRDSFSKIKNMDKMIDKAMTNSIVANQLGAQVATIFESGRLTDEDVLRYTRRTGLPERAADILLNLRSGTISTDKASDIRESLKILRGALDDQINSRAMEKASVFTNMYPEIDSNEIVKNIYSSYKDPESSSQKSMVRVRRKSDGREITVSADKAKQILKDDKYEKAE